MKQTFICFLLALMVSFSANSFAQEVPNAPNVQRKYVGSNTGDPNDASSIVTPKQYSPKALQLIGQIQQIRNNFNPGSRSQLDNLNRELAAETGNEVIVTPNSDVTVEQAPITPEVQGDVIGNSSLGSFGATRGLATFTEQGTATAGKIWAAFCVNTGTNDTIRVYFSANNGASWTHYANLFIGTGNNIQQDMLDLEVIGNTTGSVYVYVSYGYTDGSSNQRVSLMCLSAPVFGGTVANLVWPGTVAATQYYDLRITSDNSQYPSAAYLYLACSVDSTAGGTHIATQKTARITNPYQIAMTLSYKPDRFFWNGATTFIQRAFTDICYIRNGSADSIQVVLSGIQDSTSMFFSKSDINNGPASAGSSNGFVSGSEATAEKEWARISSNGTNNGSVICVYNLTIPGDNKNVKYIRSTNYGNWSTISGQSILWGSSSGTNYQPDIVGRRNTNMHYLAFHDLDSLHYVAVSSTGGTTHIQRMNGITTLSSSQGSKPGFRNVAGDSCFAMYPETGPTDIWAAYGCSGAITGITPSVTPVSYKLDQNYPNPFNPSTSISYSIPVKGVVKIAIYDMLGKEVATLVNEVKETGNYIVDFNASHLSSGAYFYKITSNDFTAVKKMVLMK